MPTTPSLYFKLKKEAINLSRPVCCLPTTVRTSARGFWGAVPKKDALCELFTNGHED